MIYMVGADGNGLWFGNPEPPKGPDALERVFAPDGLMAAKFPGYIRRDPQMHFTRAAFSAINQRRFLINESSTGTGKSASYITAALIWQQQQPIDEETKRRPQIVISTANNALSEQLVSKDLPMLQRVLPFPFTYGLLKGRANFTCKAAIALGSLQGSFSQDEDSTEWQDMIGDILDWAQETMTGDRSELAFDPPFDIWRRFSISTEDCPGKRCAFYKSCFAYAAQRKAMACDVIVTNHHVVILDSLVTESGGKSTLLPASGVLILDEVHELVTIARDMLGGFVSAGMLGAALKSAEEGLPRDAATGLRETLRIQIRGFDDRMAIIRETEHKIRLREPGILGLEGLIENFVELSVIVMDHLGKFSDAALSEDADPTTKSRVAALEIANRKIDGALRVLHYVEEQPDGIAVSVEGQDSRFRAVARVVEPGEKLKAQLFTGRWHSVVATSATATAKGSFEYLLKRLGFERPKTDMLIVDNAFDWQRNGLLVLPDDVPENPNSDEYVEAMCAMLKRTVFLSKGRLLGLFTSYKNLNAAHAALQNIPYRLLKQGDIPRTRLVELFRQDKHSVLLGTTSLWAGIDVQGEACSVVFIDKIPFDHFEDPVMDYIREVEQETWFTDHSLARAILTLKQGVGRLLRSITDRGVVIITDPRMRTKKYGLDIIESLPPMRRTSDLNQISRFLDGSL